MTKEKIFGFIRYMSLLSLAYAVMFWLSQVIIVTYGFTFIGVALFLANFCVFAFFVYRLDLNYFS